MGLKFQHLVQEFSDQVKAANISQETEVFLDVYREDENGVHVATAHEPITTLVQVKVEGRSPGDAENAFALSIYRGTILDNLKRAILDLPDSLVMMRGWPTPIRIYKMELRIER
jgi:hypothetical protein